MRKTWDSAEHVGKATISILNTLIKEFHKEAKKDNPDHGLLGKLASAAGYQSQIFSGLQKNHEFAKRLQSIEKTLGVVTSENLAMGNNPVISAEKDEKNRFDGR